MERKPRRRRTGVNDEVVGGFAKVNVANAAEQEAGDSVLSASETPLPALSSGAQLIGEQ